MNQQVILFSPTKKFADTLLDECSMNVYIALIHAIRSGWVSKVNSSIFYVNYNDNACYLHEIIKSLTVYIKRNRN